MRTWLGWVGLGGLLAVGVVGCGASTVPLDNVDEEFVDGVCEQLRSCPELWRDEIGVLVNLFEAELRDGTCEDLLASISGVSRPPSDVAGVDAGTIDYDSAAARRCVRALVNDCIPFQFADSLPECDDVFTGTVPVGDSCTSTSECQPNAYCDTTLPCDGTCAARSTLGTPCFSSETCVASEGRTADCAMEGLERVCVEYTITGGAGVGEDCGEIDGDGTERSVAFCASGLFCRTDGDVGACALPVAAGASCDGDDVCEKGYFCAGGTCRTATFADTVGAACDEDTYSFCDGSLGLACDADTGLCVSIGDGSLGSPCTAPDDEFISLFVCDDGLYCNREADVPTCSTPLDLGDPCDEDFQCASGYCVGDLCSEPVLCDDGGFVI